VYPRDFRRARNATGNARIARARAAGAANSIRPAPPRSREPSSGRARGVRPRAGSRHR
jgi:hypothetical protein